IASDGQTRAASRAAASNSGAGFSVRRTTMPSCSSWSNTWGDLRTHCPAPMQRSLLMVIRMRVAFGWSPGQGKLVHSVDEHVMAEAKLLEWDGEAEVGQPVEQRSIDDAQLGAREHLAQALMDAEAECDVAGRVPFHVESVRIRKQI